MKLEEDSANTANKTKNGLSAFSISALLFIFVFATFFSASYFGQKAARARRDLGLLESRIRTKEEREAELDRELKEAKKRERDWAKRSAKEVNRIDPVEAAQAQSDQIPSSAETDPRIITHGNRDHPKVAITIDDGWNADSRILDLMQTYGIKCTVFVIGGRDVGETHPEWIARMDALGFEVCTHTYSHFIVTGLTQAELDKDIKKGQRVLTDSTGKIYPYIRTCGGVYTDEALEVIDDLNYKLVLWDVELRDTSANATVENQVQNVLGNIQNGSIILCHFGGYNTFEALQILIPELQNRGYEITTVSDIVK
jgi:peptidoglycan/xylan/chitin deacetylase (PgdA/CDA1 family)